MIKALVRRVRAIMSDERGEFGIKGLAITVGVIVVVGALVLWLGSGGGMQGFITQVWDEGLWPWIQNVFNIGWS